MTPLASQLEHMQWLASRFRRERTAIEIAGTMTREDINDRVTAHMDIIGTLQWMLANEAEIRAYIARRTIDGSRAPD